MVEKWGGYRMTLQEAYDKNEKETFLSIAYNLCAFRKVTHHEFCMLEATYEKRNSLKTEKPNGKVICGNYGFNDKGNFIKKKC